MEPHEGQYVQRKSEMPREPPNDERLTEGRRDGKNKKNENSATPRRGEIRMVAPCWRVTVCTFSLASQVQIRPRRLGFTARTAAGHRRAATYPILTYPNTTY